MTETLLLQLKTESTTFTISAMSCPKVPSLFVTPGEGAGCTIAIDPDLFPCKRDRESLAGGDSSGERVPCAGEQRGIVLVTSSSPIPEGGTPILELGRNARHPILDRWDGQPFISHTYSQSRGEGHHTPHRATQGCPGEQSEPVGLWETGVVVTRGGCASLFPGRGCDWLV